MSSRVLLTDDTEMNLASPRSAPRIYGDLPAGALGMIDSVDAGNGDNLPVGPPGDRDRTLAASALAVAQGGRETVMVVTDDEALADWIAGMAAAMGDVDVAILPAPSIELLDWMHACGAISTPVVTAVSDAEHSHLLERDISAGLREQKLRRLNQMVVAAATRDAKRDLNHG